MVNLKRNAISYKVKNVSEVQIEEGLSVEALAAIIMNFYNDVIEEYDVLVVALEWDEYRSKLKKLKFDMKNHMFLLSSHLLWKHRK